MLGLFVFLLITLIVLELLKGLSANGTPPVMQKFSWQLDLAYVMWSSIVALRVALGLALLALLIAAPVETRPWMIGAAVPLGLIWGGIYWVFNRFWVGKYKFLPITQKVFATADRNQVAPDIQVIGVDLGGLQRAYPANLLFYHHQITDEIAGHPIWATYCGLCRSGRVYDLNVEGKALEFGLVGAITFNAVFRDTATGSWWRQETGEAVKGPLQGRQLQDIPFEQMSLANWLAKHPGSEVLQYDPTFQQKYNFTAKLMSFEASLPGWHRQDTPPLVIGVEVGGQPRAYDWNSLKNRRIVQDNLAGTPLLVISDKARSSGFVYDRTLGGVAVDFELRGERLFDIETGSEWDDFGRCVKGDRTGAELRQIQSYQQFLRAWISFHPGTSFYEF